MPLKILHPRIWRNGVKGLRQSRQVTNGLAQTHLTLSPENLLSAAMNALLQTRWLPVLLLVFSNVFMTFAWYGHLKHKAAPLWLVILASWGIAFFEYVLMVPANRWGNSVYSATELKIIQEAITIVVFCIFAISYLGEK